MTQTLKWLGHSAFLLRTSTAKTFLIDPWLSGNPQAAVRIEDLPKADYVLITHDHADHAGDCVAVARQTDATLIAQPETVARYSADGVERAESMNVGGTLDLGGVRVTMTDAYHTSETGVAAGYIVELADGVTLYHAGDTGLHANMATWGELFDIDVALLPIGGRYTMDGRQAAKALKLLRATRAVPMHYATFPFLAPDADEFVRQARAEAADVSIEILDPGDEIHI